MTSKHFAFPLGASVILAACGGAHTAEHGTGGSGGATSASDVSATSTGPGTTANTGGTSGANTGATSGTSGTGVTTTTGGGGNHGFANAVALTPGTATNGSLKNVSTPDYYSFSGKKGQRLVITAEAEQLVQGSTNLSDPTVTNTVITLFMPDMTTQWAQADDWWPKLTTDARLFTELPADGTYYVVVEDCNSAFGPSACAPASGVTKLGYRVLVEDAQELMGMITAQNGVPPPPAITYSVPAGQKAGQYGHQILGGDYVGAYDCHSYAFTPPADLFVDPMSRPRAYFFVQPIGAKGTGAASALHLIASTDLKETNILAQADQVTFGTGATSGPLALSFPITPGQTYYIGVHNDNTAPLPGKPIYYFIDHFVGSYSFGQPERETASSHSNDTAAQAEALTSPLTAKNGFYADGNLGSAGDVDWYKMAVPSGTSKVHFACQAGRAGSGLGGFSAQLFGDAAGTKSIASLGPEVIPPVTDLDTTVAWAGGAGTATLKLAFSYQSAPNNGSYYRCSMDFQ